MPNCRQSLDINLFRRLYKETWNIYYRDIARKLTKELFFKFSKPVFIDTFMPIVCEYIWHIKYQPNKYEPNIACKRCQKFIK